MEVELDSEYRLRHEPSLLSDAYNALQGKSVLQRTPKAEQFEPLTAAPFVSVGSRIVHVLRGLVTGKVKKLRQLFSRDGTRSQTVATFLAVLEPVSYTHLQPCLDAQREKSESSSGRFPPLYLRLHPLPAFRQSDPRAVKDKSSKPRIKRCGAFFAAFTDSTMRWLCAGRRFAILAGKGEETMDCDKMGALLLRLRKERGLTQKQLADELMLSDRTISKWSGARAARTCRCCRGCRACSGWKSGACWKAK